MGQPGTEPRWVTDANAASSTYVVAPTSGKLDVGFAVQERPPAQYMNWVLYWICKWVDYLKNLSSETFAWVAPYRFTGTSGARYVGPAGMIEEQLDATPQWFTGANGERQRTGNGRNLRCDYQGAYADQIRGVTVYVKNSTAGPGKMDASLWKHDISTDTVTQMSDIVALGNFTSVKPLVLTGINNIGGASSPTPIGLHEVWFVRVRDDGTNATRDVYGVEFTYDHP